MAKEPKIIRDKYSLFTFYHTPLKGTLSVFFRLKGKAQRRKLKEGIDYILRGKTIKLLKNIK